MALPVPVPPSKARSRASSCSMSGSQKPPMPYCIFTFQTARGANAPLPVFFIEAPGRPVFLSPPDTRGWRARGRCRSSSMSAPPCEDAEAPPGAPPEHLSMPGLICGRLHSASPTVVNGTCCAGLRFPGRRLRAGLNGHTPQPAPGWRLVVAAGRGTARGPGAWEARSSPARGRRILLHHQTPLDDAPRLSRT